MTSPPRPPPGLRLPYILFCLTCVMSSLGGYSIYAFLTSSPAGGHEGILYAVGVLATAPALLLGIAAALVLRAARHENSDRFKVRCFWLPASLPALVLLGLHLMLLKR